YGSLDALFSWTHVGANVRNYSIWLIDAQSPVILLAFFAPFLTRIKSSPFMFQFIMAVAALYLPYLVFDNWTFLRFFLPAIPFLLLLSAAAVLAAIGRLPIGFRGAAVFLVSVLLPTWSFVKADSLRVFHIQRAEHRYVSVGEFLRDRLPSNAVVISVTQ